LGALFLAAGDAGVNLEDVRIEHTVGRLTAIAHLYVLPEVAPSLREVLAQSTWRLLG
jgi:prephenate dehydrogenase